MIINDAITNVYSVIAVWIPVTVVPTSLATVAIDTFITELSSVIRNCPAASVARTVPAAVAAEPACWPNLSGSRGSHREVRNSIRHAPPQSVPRLASPYCAILSEAPEPCSTTGGATVRRTR